MNYIGSINEFSHFFGMYDKLIGNMHVFANGVMLGCTNGATVLDATPSYTDIICTQQGASPSDQVISGTEYKLTVPVTGMALATLAQMSPLVHIDPMLGKAIFSKGIGVSLKRDFPIHLVIAEADSDGAPNFDQPYALFPLATLASPLQMQGSNDQRTTNLEFILHSVNLDSYADQDDWFKGKRIIGFTSHTLENAKVAFPQALVDKHMAYRRLQHNEMQMVIGYPQGTQLSLEKSQALVQVSGKLHLVEDLKVEGEQVMIDLSALGIKMSDEVAIYLPMKHLYANGRPAAPLPMVVSNFVAELAP